MQGKQSKYKRARVLTIITVDLLYILKRKYTQISLPYFKKCPLYILRLCRSKHLVHSTISTC